MAAVWRSQCAFVRNFGVKTIQILNNATYSGIKLTREPKSFGAVSRNYSNYGKSLFVERIKEQYEFDVTKNPETWQYVERLMPLGTIPDVSPKENYPSGWVAPKEEAKEHPYFIPRTKNHVLPVYLKLTKRESAKRTIVKKLEGDIWLMNDDLKAFLKKKNSKYVETRVHEMARFIEIKGDYVNDVKSWAYSKGF